MDNKIIYHMIYNVVHGGKVIVVKIHADEDQAAKPNSKELQAKVKETLCKHDALVAEKGKIIFIDKIVAA